MVSSAVSSAGEMLSQTILDSMLQWYCETIYNAVADFFAQMGNMGAELFELSWVSATVQLFTLFGWSLFVAGMVVAVFDVAVESRNNSVDIKGEFKKRGFGGSRTGSIAKQFQSDPICKMDFAVAGQYDCLCLLCREDFLCQHQAWRNTSGADCGWLTVYVQCSERVSGRLQSVDKTGNRHLSDGVFTDDTSVSRNVDIH